MIPIGLSNDVSVMFVSPLRNRGIANAAIPYELHVRCVNLDPFTVTENDVSPLIIDIYTYFREVGQITRHDNFGIHAPFP
jgi:hypothetical protein